MTAYILQPHHVKKPIYAQIKDEHRCNTTYDIYMGDTFITHARRIGEAKAFLSGAWWAISGEQLNFPPRRKQLSILPRREKCMVSNDTMFRRYGVVPHSHVRGSQISLLDRSDPNNPITLWSATRRSSNEIDLYVRGVGFAFFGPHTQPQKRDWLIVRPEHSPGLSGTKATQIIKDDVL